MRHLRILVLAVVLAGGCNPSPASAPVSEDRVSWMHAFDLDGDGRNDRIEVLFTGGGHCCYRITVHLSSNGAVYRLPFQLDGGYVGGLDLSRPHHFDIRKTDGPLPELVMEIETYNGKPLPLPKEWEKKFRIKTHYIAVGFDDGRMRVRDIPPRK